MLLFLLSYYFFIYSMVWTYFLCNHCGIFRKNHWNGSGKGFTHRCYGPNNAWIETLHFVPGNDYLTKPVKLSSCSNHITSATPHCCELVWKIHDQIPDVIKEYKFKDSLGQSIQTQIETTQSVNASTSTESKNDMEVDNLIKQASVNIMHDETNDLFFENLAKQKTMCKGSWKNIQSNTGIPAEYAQQKLYRAKMEYKKTNKNHQVTYVTETKKKKSEEHT
eukprot:218421_1